MRALGRRAWRGFCGFIGAFALVPAVSWPDVDDYVKKLQVIENREENSIMLHSVSATPLLNTSNYPALDSTARDSQGGILTQSFVDFEKICKEIPAFLKTASKEDVYEMHTVIAAINSTA